MSSVFNVCLSFTKQVNYKVSSIAKNLCTFVIAEQFDWSRKISLAITRQITQEDINLLLTKTTATRSSQEAVMTSYCSQMNKKEGWLSSSLKNKSFFLDFAEQNINIFFSEPKPYSTTSYEHVSIITLGELQDSSTFVSA